MWAWLTGWYLQSQRLLLNLNILIYSGIYIGKNNFFYEICLFCTRQKHLISSWIFIAHWNKSAGRYVTAYRPHYPNSNPISLCFYSLLPYAYISEEATNADLNLWFGSEQGSPTIMDGLYYCWNCYKSTYVLTTDTYDVMLTKVLTNCYLIMLIIHFFHHQ
jgi:hypothetical protein